MKVNTFQKGFDFNKAPSYKNRDKIAAGDYYGTGIKPAVGKVRDSYFLDKNFEKMLNDPPMKMN